MGFKDVSQYYRSLIGRPCCIFCTWNPSQDEEKRGVYCIKGEGGMGYLGNYPDNVWSDHIKEKHPEMLDPNRGKIIHWLPGVWKWVKDATPEELAEVE